MALTRTQQIFRDNLAAQTGLDRRFVGAWLLAEEGGRGGPASNYDKRHYYNYLNIARTDSNLNAPGSHGAYFNDPVTAAKATADWIKGQGPITRSYGKAAPGIRRLPETAGQGVAAQIAALSKSGWASSGYNGGDTLRSLLQQTQGGAQDSTRGAPARLPSTSSPSSTSSTTTTTTQPAQSVDLAALLSAQKPVARQSAGIQGPAFSSSQYLASTGQAPVSTVPRQQGKDYGSLVAAISAQQPAVTTTTTSSSAVKPASAITKDGSTTSHIAALVERANQIDQQHLPYLWGGGHGAKVSNYAKTAPLDCSGAVSAILGINPRVASQFKTFGSAGASPSGKGITIYAKDTHVLMEINGHFFGTSASNPGGGAGWISRKAIPPGYLKGFTARHLANAG